MARQGVADAQTAAVREEWVVKDCDRTNPSWLPDGHTIIASEQETNAQGPYRALIALDIATSATLERK